MTTVFGIEVYDAIRLLNATTALVCLIFMWRLYPWWITRSRPERFVLASLFVLAMVTGYGSVEAYMTDVPPGARVVLYTPALFICLYGLVGLNRRVRKYRKEEKKKEGKP